MKQSQFNNDTSVGHTISENIDCFYIGIKVIFNDYHRL